MASTPSSDGAKPPARPRPRFRHPILLGIVYVLWIGILCWGGLKFFWWWRFGVKVTESPGAETVWNCFYPELDRSGVMTARLAPDDGYYDVLLLGGSVLEQTAPRLEQQLRGELGSRLRLYNLARAAHTSRDSFLKYQHLGSRHFDLVIFYHGINDARMNRCPDDAFREDYTHVSFYRGFQERLAAGRMQLTDFVHNDFAEAKPKETDDQLSKRYSARIKTAVAFRHNLEPIVQTAEDRHCPIVLMTFAYHIPPNYTDEAFRARRLDYGASALAAEVSLWGTPEGVKRAIDAHNQVIRDVASRHKNVIFVDQKATMPADGRHFIDPCHLTNEGTALFVRHVMEALRARGEFAIARGEGRKAAGKEKRAPDPGSNLPRVLESSPASRN
jgi:lysophospholipase L1-like esterase